VALAVCVAVLLCTGVAAAFVVGNEAPAGQSRPARVPSALPAGEAGPSVPLIDLGAVVVGGPPGFEQFPDAKLLVGGAAGVERLAAERADQTRARAIFTETGLVGGFVRAWQRPTTAELVTVRLYQFNNAEGAKTYANKVITAMSVAPATKFTVPATSDTTGIDSQVVQGANRLVYVVGRKGRVVAAIAATRGPPPEGGFLPPLARSQLSLLP